MITYEITKILPQQLRVQIKYSKEGFPDFWKNVVVEDFSEDNIHALAEGGADSAKRFYDAIELLPNEVELSTMSGTAKEIVYADRPEIDHSTQVIELSWTETDTQKIEVVTVRDKTALEIEQGLTAKRRGSLITMRQARLYLSAENLLVQIEQSIASLPEEQKSVVEIEWQHGSTVERMSLTVELLQGILGWTDDQLDQMFDAALLL